MKDDKIIFKKPENAIDKMLRNEILKRRLNAEVKKEKAFNSVIKKLKNYFPIQILLGLVACFFMFWIYGGKTLFETLLSWVIGMTIIATFITTILSRYQKEK